MQDKPPQIDDALAAGFASPPDGAKPRVWWHWMNGNVTKEGIQKDMQWMKRVGIGGLQNFDGALGTPQVVEERLVYMTPKWRDAFRYATELADELGLEFAIASSPGWSETGGPWVEPKDGMKKLVWSTTALVGTRPFKDSLSAPPAMAGPFQTMPTIDLISRKQGEGPRFYRDVAVIAYRTPKARLQEPKPIEVTTSAAAVDGRARLDDVLADNLANTIALPIGPEQSAWVLYDYGGPQRMRSVSVARPATMMSSVNWIIEASDDGKVFRPVVELPNGQLLHHTTVTFPAVTARYWRLNLRAGPIKFLLELGANAPGAEIDASFAQPLREIRLYGLRFHAGARVHRFEEKGGFSVAVSYYGMECGTNDAEEAVLPQDIVDLSTRMQPDGTLDWTAPAGDWTVLRLGYSLTGKTNHPASPEATGLEVDKLDKQAVKAYLDVYLGNFEKTVGAERIGGRGIRAFLTDSIEASGQNWTPAMIAEFKARRGYDLTLWLPALTGVIIGNATRTDRFLWDFRRTLMELMSESHYGQIAASAHQRGLIYYSESLEGYPFMALGDDLDMRVPADIPMAAVWTNYRSAESDGILGHIVDMRGAASVAHVFGKTLVAAESLTSAYEPWAFSPATLRPVMDLAFVLGVNRPVIHTSVHQPVEKKPGLTLGPYGQHFTRHESWAEFAGPWVAYLSRCSYLLQQGRHVADMAYFYGEEGPLASLYVNGAPTDLPQGHGFDFVSANMLLHRLQAQNGLLVSSGGANYRLLYLGGGSTRMTLPVLRRIKALSDQGVAVAGSRPQGSPSLADEGFEEEYRGLVAQLWDSGKIHSGGDSNAALAHLGLVPDFDYEKSESDAQVMFLHRKLTEGDLYFLTNRKARAERIEARFRVTGRRPELWHADTGEHEAVSWRIENGCTVVPLELYAHQSVFVLFRERIQKSGAELPARKTQVLAQLAGDWQLSFESGRGAPEQAFSTALSSWTEHDEPGIKYFSGIGTYRKTFDWDPVHLGVGERILLDLGRIHELAEVALNGKSVGTVWHAPFRLDVTAALEPGLNTLEIRVANLWVNRLIGDKQPGATPVAFTVTSTYKPDAPLRPSGLVGPVTLIRSAHS